MRDGTAALGKLGVEIELLAPKGRSRLDLAVAIAERMGGKVRRFFHPQGEPSKAPGTPFFENLTLGFVVEDERGRVVAQCVDDLTLQDDLDKQCAPLPGWYRVVSDDARFLRLAMRHANAEDALETVLDPVAALFGVEPVRGGGGMYRVADEAGSPIVLGAPLPGERERPCELITAPMEGKHLEQLEMLLGLARDMGFTVPAEGATHLHFDGERLASASALVNLVRFLSVHGEVLKDRVGTNPRCRRLGAWPGELLAAVEEPDFARLEWWEVVNRLRQMKLSKYCDFNLRNLIYPSADKFTFEVRILPVSLEGERVIEVARGFAAILDWAAGEPGVVKAVPEDLASFFGGV